MEFRPTGSQETLYWLTVPLTLVGPDGTHVIGTFLLDTGGKTMVTKLKVGPSNKRPKSVFFGSGEVMGYPQNGVSIPELGAENISVVHDVWKFPFHDEIDGILPLVPNREDPDFSLPITAVEFDFRARRVYINHVLRPPLIFASARPRICQSVGQERWKYPGRPWMRGNLVLTSNTGDTHHFNNVWFMLDTGATVAATFFDRFFNEIKQCSSSRKVVQMTLEVGKNKITQPLFSNTPWPSCVPGTSFWVYNVVVGIQFLNGLTSFGYVTNEKTKQVEHVCVVP